MIYFNSNNSKVTTLDLKKLANDMKHQMEEGLKGSTSSSLKMLPTYVGKPT